MIYICLLLLGVYSVNGDIRRQLIDPGFGMPLPGVVSQSSCDTICDEETHETGVCGSDGTYYHTKCDFNKAVCAASQAGDRLSVTNYGPCIDLNSTCDAVLHARCSYPNIVATGGRRAVDGDFYCGSDKKTYSSACEFRQSQCRLQQLGSASQLTLDHVGKCVLNKDQMLMIDCSKYTIDDGSSQLAVETSNLVTITCARNYNPVCANVPYSFGTTTYDRTFSNECSVCQYMHTHRKITRDNMMTYALHEGPCNQNSIFG